MRRLPICRLLLFFTLLAAALGASAGEVPSLTRTEAVHRAVRQNPRVAAADKRQEAAQERITQARSGFWPQLSFSERYATTTNPMWAFGTRLNQERITLRDFDPDLLNDPERIDNFASTFSARWSIYDNGRTRYGIHQAEEGAAVTERMGLRTRQQAMADAATAYDGWLMALAVRRAIDQALALARSHLDAITERYEAGFVVKSDLLRARVRKAELDQRRLSAESQAAIAASHLNAAMGEAPESVFTPGESLVANHGPERSMEEWVADALANRPELGALAGREAIARTEIDKSRAAHHPSLSLFGDYEIDSEEFRGSGENYTLGAMVELSLFSGYRDVARIREAQAALGEVEAQRRELETGIRVDTRQAFLEADSAWRRIAVAAAGVEQAEENLTIVSQRYRNGLLTVVHLLDAETALEQARLQRLQAVYDYRTAWVRLLLAAGRIDEDLGN